MTELVLVGCTKSKRDSAALGLRLYDESPLFRKRRKVARKRGDHWGILSAEHGFILPERRLEPYDTFIGDRDSELWANQVLDDLRPLLRDVGVSQVTILAGRKYVDPLVTPLEAEGYDVLDPLRGLGNGKRMSRLDEMAEETEQTTLVQADGGCNGRSLHTEREQSEVGSQ